MSEKSTWTWFLFLPDDPLQEPRIVFDGYIAPESGTIIEVVNAKRITELEAENKLLDAHAKEWGIKAQQAEAEIEALKHDVKMRQRDNDELSAYIKKIDPDALQAEIERLKAENKQLTEWLERGNAHVGMLVVESERLRSFIKRQKILGRQLGSWTTITDEQIDNAVYDIARENK